jgi:hypothetical protein
LICFATAIYKDASPTGLKNPCPSVVEDLFTPIVHPKMNTGKEFPSACAPVFTALRRGESLRRDKSGSLFFCWLRQTLRGNPIYVLFQQRCAPF